MKLRAFFYQKRAMFLVGRWAGVLGMIAGLGLWGQGTDAVPRVPAPAAFSESAIRPADDAPRPMTPAESAACMKLPAGLTVWLAASEPLIQDPSGIVFDEQGRLFVCELHGYNVEGHLDVMELNKSGQLDKQVRRLRWEFMGGKIAEEAARRQFGTVKLLQDTDGDGLMDRAEVWAEDLPPCYGMAAARGGVIVACAPDIVYLADADGDGRADVREMLFTGFRVRTLERGINNPRWGLDGWIYVGGGGEGGVIRGPYLKEPVELGAGDFRIRADGSAIEPVNGRVGTFGLTINDVGDRFPSSGGTPAMYALPVPHRYLKRNPHVASPPTNHQASDYHRGFRLSKPHPWRVRRQQDPAWIAFYGARETSSDYFSGGCSAEFYNGRLLPTAYRGSLFYCEPSLNLVHRAVLRRHGNGYTATRAPGEDQSEFLASTDQWFRPMSLRFGPDGALYLVDMYREIIEDYSAIPRFLQQQYGLQNGKERGRIWRIAPNSVSRATLPTPWPAQMNAKQLAARIDDGEAWWRFTAQRLIVERNLTEAAGALQKHIRQDHSSSGSLHALYALAELNHLRPADIERALNSAFFAVRLHGLRLAEPWLDTAAVHAKVCGMTNDPDSRVRLQLALTLGESSHPNADRALLNLAHHRTHERWMPEAILTSANGRAVRLLAGLLDTDFPLPANADRSLLAPLAATLAGQRDGEAMARLLATLADYDEAAQTACLEGLIQGLPPEPLPEHVSNRESFRKLWQSESFAVRELAARLSTKWPLADREPLKALFADATRRALDETAALETRRHSIRLLANAPFEFVEPAAKRLTAASQAPALQHAALAALGASRDRRAGTALLAGWTGYSPSLREAALQAVLSRRERLPALLQALAEKRIPADDLSAVRKQRLTGNPDPAIAKRSRQLLAARAPEKNQQRELERYQTALGVPGDLERGREIFAQICSACHRAGGVGADVGPSLAGIANKSDESILLDVLAPNSKIAPEYRVYVATTRAGETYSGILASESATSVSLREGRTHSAAATHTILRKDIESLRAAEVSLMPDNLAELVSPTDMADLIDYLRRAFAEAPAER